MDKREIYEPLIEGRGTPILCRSLDEVTALVSDMCQLFPEQERQLTGVINIYGKARYKDEIVCRFARRVDDNNRITINFCTASFYRGEGYDIVQFSDLIDLDRNDNDEDSSAFAEAFRNLFV